MPKCPKCKAEIDSLNYMETGLMEYSTNLNEWLKSESVDIEFTCPECGAKVTLDTLE
jgi:predicted RNA-binding Zn-ribbon protein involved in translation (DUF1610 family)